MNMETESRGFAVIMNNLCSDNNELIQQAASQDETNLATLFKYLGYEVEIKQGLNKTDMTTYLQQVASRDHENYDSFVCCILSHGGVKGNLYYGSSNDPVQFNDLIDIFNGDACETLKGKPKIFFVNACRGTKRMPPTLGAVPDTADFLFCYATQPGYVAYIDCHGSRYIEEICKVITENATYASLSDMMVKVSEKVGGIETASVYAPEITSRLKKLVYFF